MLGRWVVESSQGSGSQLNAEQLRKLALELIARIAEQSKTVAAEDSDILYRQAKIDKLMHELVTLKRTGSKPILIVVGLACRGWEEKHSQTA